VKSTTSSSSRRRAAGDMYEQPRFSVPWQVVDPLGGRTLFNLYPAVPMDKYALSADGCKLLRDIDLKVV
jgi:hypothetical protein